jgi:catechol 2,3-dioxygenase-like lactoylglutathione lyase family enzyme
MKPIEFQGIDHIAFTTSDMARAVAFYHGLLGMPIIHQMEYEKEDEQGNITAYAQHFYFGVGGENSQAHFGIFTFKKLNPQSGIVEPNRPGAFFHVNLKVDPTRIREYCERLSAAGVQYVHQTRYSDSKSRRPSERWRVIKSENSYHEPQPGALMSSVYFTDPDGFNLEFNAWLPGWAEAFTDKVEPWPSQLPENARQVEKAGSY